jgi:DNA-binding transcriptional LysR family regulator
MRINLRQIEAFRAAMEFGSATAASEVLHITQPAVSRLVSDLEFAVGFQLFERRARGLVPTQDAHTLYEEVRRSFIGMERIGQVAGAIKEKATGTVRVIALSKYADGFVASIVGSFLKRNPGIMVELESAGTRAVVLGIASQTYDVGIASAAVSDSLIQAEPLFETSVVLAMAHDDPLASQSVVPLRALNNRRMVVLREDSEYGSVIAKGLHQAKVTPEVVGQARSHPSLYRMVGSGAGLALIDKTITADFDTEGVTFRPVDPPIVRSVATLVNTRVARSIATNSFLETLRNNVRHYVGD